jgi:hypothetical protein
MRCDLSLSSTPHQISINVYINFVSHHMMIHSTTFFIFCFILFNVCTGIVERRRDSTPSWLDPETFPDDILLAPDTYTIPKPPVSLPDAFCYQDVHLRSSEQKKIVRLLL